jgi:hypothetical protein
MDSAGEDYASTDAFLEMLQADLGGDKVYSSEREYDYEEMYRKEHPEDSADALMALIETEDGGNLFDKVSSGQASRRETEAFKRLAADGGVYPEHVQSIIKDGQRAKAEGVQDSLRGKAAGDTQSAGRDSDVEFNPEDYETSGDILFQKSHPQQLGFIGGDLIQESYARPKDATKEQVEYADRYARDEALKKAFGEDNFVTLQGLLQD